MRYDHSKGRREEHVNPHRVAGTVPGRTWQARAHTMDEHARTMRPELDGKHVHRTALRLAPEDRRLTDKEWRAVSERYVKDMGFDGCPWEATRHADDHVHLTVSRVQWDGELAPDSHDFAKAQTAARALEREHGLIDASKRYDRDRPQVSHGEKESAARREVVPEREQLRDAVRAAERESGRTREGFEAALGRRGVLAEANVAKTGRVSGYRYGLAGHDDGQGQQVWFKGSQLGRDQSWAKTRERIEAAPQLTTGEKQVPEHPAEVQADAAPKRPSAAERVQAANTQSQGRQNTRPEAVQGPTPGPRPTQEERDQPMRETTPAGATEARRDDTTPSPQPQNTADRVRAARERADRAAERENER